MIKFTPAAALILVSSFIFHSGCQMFVPGENSKYGSSTQGYKLSQDQLKGITVGMTKEEVKEALGEPHTNPFYPNIWTYVYVEHSKKKGKMATITFQDNKVTNIQMQ
jgi:outer membrane protein assembly factor BamE (lipoprotein component of BamABCDE complex)